MLSLLVRPTPKQLYYISIGYVVIASLLGYFLSGWLIALMGAFGGLQIINSVRELNQQDKLRDKQKSKKEWFVYFSIPFAIIFYLVFYGGVLFREDFVINKNELSQTTGIIPANSTKKETGSGKSRRTYYYLTINDINLHCSEDDYDDCDKIYTHKDKTATVYYQPDTKNGNLVYEIVVNNTKIYTFEEQLTKFQYKRHQENRQFFWAFILYFLPAFYFIFAHRSAVEYIDEMSEDEKEEYDTQLKIKEYKEKIEQTKKQRVAIKDYGIFGFLVFLFGLACFIIAMGLFLFASDLQETIRLILFAVFMIIGGVCTYYSYQSAKYYRDERIDEEIAELKEELEALTPSNTTTTNTQTFPNTHHTTSNPSGFDNPAHQNTANQPLSTHTTYHPTQYPTTSHYPTTYHHDNKYKDKDEDKYEEAYDDEDDTVKWAIISDFGILNLFIFIMGLSAIILNIMIIFDNSENKDHPLFWWFVAFFIIGGIIMMYKTFSYAKFNKDMRAGLYDDWEYEEEIEEELPFLSRLFRLLVLLVLVPLFLYFSYTALITLINLQFKPTFGSVFFLIVIGYGIKKAWWVKFNHSS